MLVQDEEDRVSTNDVSELLRYHHQFVHISFKKLQEMAKQGIIPKRLGNVQFQSALHVYMPRPHKNNGETKQEATTEKDPEI